MIMLHRLTGGALSSLSDPFTCGAESFVACGEDFCGLLDVEAEDFGCGVEIDEAASGPVFVEGKGLPGEFDVEGLGSTPLVGTEGDGCVVDVEA